MSKGQPKVRRDAGSQRRQRDERADRTERRHDVLRPGTDGVRPDVHERGHGRGLGVRLVHHAEPERGPDVRPTGAHHRPGHVQQRGGRGPGQVSGVPARRHRRVADRVRNAPALRRGQVQSHVGFHLNAHPWAAGARRLQRAVISLCRRTSPSVVSDPSVLNRDPCSCGAHEHIYAPSLLYTYAL